MCNNNTAIILGNGPSLRGFDFKKELDGFDTFGMNVAYRYWDMINWYPKFYISNDPAICASHKKEIVRLINNKDIYGIKKFIVTPVILKYYNKIGLYIDHITTFTSFCIRNNLLKFIPTPQNSPSTGAAAAIWAMGLGYKKIILLGIDANYKMDNLDFVKTQNINLGYSDSILCTVKDKPIQNTNYFFDEYQQKGDMFYIENQNVRTENKRHIVGWKCVKPIMENLNAIIINANPSSLLNIFYKCTWNEAKIKYLNVVSDLSN